MEATILGLNTITHAWHLIYAGRTPNSDRLNLQAAGVEVDQIGAIKVDFSFFASCFFLLCLLDIFTPGIYF